MGKRLDYIDIAKGLGMILVILGHIRHDYVPFCGSVHIPLFFVLSGFLYDIDKNEERTYGENVLKRVKRLIVPYFIYNIVLYLKYLLKLLLTHQADVKSVLEPFLGFVYSAPMLYRTGSAADNYEGFVFGNGPLWFLTSMAVSSVIFYFVIYYVLKHRFDIKKIAAVSVILIVIAKLMYSFLPVYLPWSTENAFVGAVFMIFGMCLRKYNVAERMKTNFAVGSLLLFVILHKFNGSANLAIQDYGRSLAVYVVLGMCGSVIVLFISLWIEKCRSIAAAVSYVGQNTLIILAFHMTIISMFVNVLEKLHLESFTETTAYFAVAFLVGLSGCVVINEFVTKICRVPKRFL